MSPTSGELVDQRRREQEVRQQLFDRRMAQMIQETRDAPAAPVIPPAAVPAASPQGASKVTGKPIIEIRGLSAAVASAKKGIADVRTAAAALNTESTALVTEITDLTSQIRQHRDDLKFEAETLGNSGGNGEQSGSNEH